MKPYMMLPAALTLFSFGYMLLGMRFFRLWGVNPDRMTPAAEREKGTNALLLLFAGVLADGALALPCAACAEETYGFAAAAAGAGVLVFLGGVLGYAAMFVSLRHEAKGVGFAAAEEIADGAKKLYELLALLMCVCTAARMLCMLAGLEKGAYAVIADAAALLGFLVLLPPALCARQIRNEAQGAPLCMGSALLAGLLAVAAAAVQAGDMQAFARIGFAPDDMNRAASALYAVCRGGIAALSAYLAGDTLHALVSGGLPQRRKPSAIKRALPYAASVLLCALAAFAGAEITGMTAAVCALLLAAETAAVCAVWFRQIGRRLI